MEKTAKINLADAGTKELIDEIENRSLSCLVVCVRIEGGTDAWRFSVKGNGILLGTMMTALQIEINSGLEERSKGGDCSFPGFMHKGEKK